jgi:hypothetical protein
MSIHKINIFDFISLHGCRLDWRRKGSHQRQFTFWHTYTPRPLNGRRAHWQKIHSLRPSREFWDNLAFRPSYCLSVFYSCSKCRLSLFESVHNISCRPMRWTQQSPISVFWCIHRFIFRDSVRHLWRSAHWFRSARAGRAAPVSAR